MWKEKGKKFESPQEFSAAHVGQLVGNLLVQGDGGSCQLSEEERKMKKGLNKEKKKQIGIGLDNMTNFIMCVDRIEI